MLKFYIGIDSATKSIGVDLLIGPLKKLAKEHKAELVITGGYGLYSLEPFLEIEFNGEKYAFRNIKKKDLTDIINEIGEPNQNHEKFTAKSTELRALKIQNRFTFKRAGLINPLSLEDYQNYGGLVGLKKALQMNSQAIIDEIKLSQIRGRGGAGFPTGIKWQTVLDTLSNQKYIVANADEGDSGTFADRLIMDSDPFSLIEGMVIAARATKANFGFVYLRSEYPFTYQQFSKALAIAYQNNLLGKNILGSKLDFDIELRKGAGAYICGEETSLLESLEGKRGMIRYKPPLPAIEGLFKKPTALNNVITLATIPEIMARGSESYASLGYNKSKGTLTIQLSGNIKRGGLYEVDFGMSLKEIIYDIGGGSLSGKKIKAVQVGGPLGAYFSEDLFDTPLDYESFSQKEGMLGHGGIVVFDETVNLAKQAKFSFEFCAHESCGKCTPCRIGSTRGAELIGSIIKDGNSDKKQVLLKDLCDLMEETSLCALGGLTPIPVKSALKHFSEDFEK